MSTTTADLKRRSAALSTNNRGFVAGGRFSEARENLNEEDLEDVRLERYRKTQRAGRQALLDAHESRNQRIVLVYEESPNGYAIAEGAPEKLEQAVKYYSFQLQHFTIGKHPEEYGFCHYCLGKRFFAEKSHHGGKDYEDRARNIENALHHFRIAVEVFDYSGYPIMFGVICTFIGQLFRERATIITSRSILAKRGVTVAESCTVGLSQLLEAVPVFAYSKLHATEHALCSLEIGWLYIMQLTEALSEEGVDTNSKKHKNSSEIAMVREQAVETLERAKALAKSTATAPLGERPRTWNPSDPSTHPHHIRLLLSSQSINYVEGMAAYLLGRCYQEWGDELLYQEKAFHQLCKSTRPNYLPDTIEQWADAHHRAALIIIRFPQVVDPEFGQDPSGATDTDLCYVSAASHLKQALKCPSIKPGRRMDLNFHLAQANIARVHMITDRVPPGQSLVGVLAQSDGLDIMKAVEVSLTEALKGSTAANTQSTQDAFVYFFSCIKLSEFRMLEAAARPEITPVEREKLLEQSVVQLINAMVARSMVDNLDLHYIGTAQLSQMLLASKRDYAATKCFAKTLLVLSAMANRVTYMPLEIKAIVQHKLWMEIERQTTQALIASGRATSWVKNHLGPVLLTESVTSGYAYWSFEQEEPAMSEAIDNNAATKLPSSPSTTGTATGKGGGGGGATGDLSMSDAKAARAPPKVLPPHLTDMEREKVERAKLLGGGGGGGSKGLHGDAEALATLSNTHSKQGQATPSSILDRAAPPPGSVPLWAMGHNPDFDQLDKLAAKTDGKFSGTYANRKRRRVPNMFDIMARSINIVTSEEKIRAAVFLMPVTGKAGGGAQVQFKIQNNDVNSWLKKTDDLTSARQKRGGLFGGILRLLGGGRGGESKEEKTAKAKALLKYDPYNDTFAPPNGSGAVVKLPAELYSSVQCFYTFMAMSQMSRAQLILTTVNLHAATGERAKIMLSGLTSEMQRTFHALRNTFLEASKKLIIPPTTLRELSRRSFEDLQGIFRGQVAVARAAADFEDFLFQRIAKEDYFLPIVCSVQALSRDIGGFDKSLLNAQGLISNMRAGEKLKKAAAIAAASAASASRKRPTSATGTSGGGGGGGGGGSPTVGGVPVIGGRRGIKKPPPVLPDPKTAAELDALEDQLGKMTFTLSAILDGSGLKGGSREMLSTQIEQNECMLLWHLPTIASNGMQCVLIWREDSALADPKDATKAATAAKEAAKGGGLKKGVVMELCKSDVDCVQMQYLLQNFLDALETSSAARRTSHATDALRSISCYLSMSEILQMIPPHVDSLIVCCPNSMRLLPWHLLLVEIPSEHFNREKDEDDEEDDSDSEKAAGNSRPRSKLKSSKDIVSRGKMEKSRKTFTGVANLLDPLETSPDDVTVEIHLVEKYCVRLGPTLQIFEMSCLEASRLKQAWGLHRLVAVDGEQSDKRSPGLRNADIEVGCVTGLFSSDPDDSTIIMSDLAAPKHITTGTVLFISKADRLKKQRVKEIKRKLREEKKKKRKADARAKRAKMSLNSDEDNDDDNDGNDEDQAGDSSDASSVSSDDEEAISNRKALNVCRVLHIAANRKGMSAQALKAAEAAATTAAGSKEGAKRVKKADKKRRKEEAAAAAAAAGHLHHMHHHHVHRRLASMEMPIYTNSKGEVTSDTRTAMTSADIVAQLHLRNCALCVLSRFGLSDEAKDAVIADANCEFIEALHLAGACTVMYPLWSGLSQGGLGTLSTLIFLIRFYTILPTLSRSKESITQAVRQSQLWMRNKTADQIIAWVSRSPIPSRLRAMLIEEMEVYIDASDKDHSDTYADIKTAMDGKPIRPGERKFFSHFLQWGSFVVCGQGGGVHPVELTEKGEDVEHEHLLFDKELDNIDMEILMLKTEGRFNEARQLEKRLRQMRIERMAKRIEDAKRVSILAGRGIMDAFDAIDKAFLDQDSDDISIDSDLAKDEGDGRRKKKKKKDKKHRKEEQEEEGEEEGEEQIKVRSEWKQRQLEEATSADGNEDGGDGDEDRLQHHEGKSREDDEGEEKNVVEHLGSLSFSTLSNLMDVKTREHVKDVLSKTPTPIKGMTAFVENLFAEPEKPKERLKVKRLVAIKSVDPYAEEKEKQRKEYLEVKRQREEEKLDQEERRRKESGDEFSPATTKRNYAIGEGRSANEQLAFLPEKSKACVVQ